MLPWFLAGVLLTAATYDPMPGQGNVFRIYQEAATRWFRGEPLYPPNSGFQYLPTSVLFWWPWTYLPMGVGGALWKLANWALFGGAVHLLLKELAVHKPAPVVAALLGAALAWTAGKYGQATLGMAGFVILGLLDERGERPLRAALWLALAMALKPLALVYVLLLGATRPRTALWALGLFVGVCGLTMCTMGPGYWIQQWKAVPAMLQTVADSAGTDARLYGIHSLSLGLGFHVSEAELFTVRIVTAACCASLVLWVGPTRQSPLLLYGLGTFYLLLFSPRTENNTFGLLSPIFAACWSHACRYDQRWVRTGCLVLAAIFCSTRSIGHWSESIGPHVTRPAIALAICLLTWSAFAQNPARRTAHEATPGPSANRASTRNS